MALIWQVVDGLLRVPAPASQETGGQGGEFFGKSVGRKKLSILLRLTDSLTEIKKNTNQIALDSRKFKIMKHRILLTIFLTLSAVTSEAARFTNNMTGFQFSPKSRTIKVGDTVVWINRDGAQHDTKCRLPAPNGWSSGLFGFNGKFERTFTNAGTFNYVCTPHEFSTGMTGTIIVQADATNAAPTVTITAPANNSNFIAPASFQVEATAADTSPGTVASVEFFVDNVSIGTDTTSPYSAQASNILEGAHTISAVATDNAGAKSTNSIFIVVNAPPINQPPTILITSPTNNQSFVAPVTSTLNANASDTDGTVVQVDFFVNGTLFGSVASGGAVQLEFTIPTARTNTFAAVATDNQGAKATNSVTVTVTEPAVVIPPKISGLQKTGDGKIRFLIEGAGASGAVEATGNLNAPFQSIGAATTTFEQIIVQNTNQFFRISVPKSP